MKRINIVHRVTRKYMMLNKKRTFTTFIGIVFMVLLMTCVFVGKNTAIHYLQDVVSYRQGKWHYALYDVTAAKRQKVKDLDYIQEMSESVSLGMVEFGKSANAKRPYLNVKAYGERCFDWYHVNLTDGRLPENEKEIILSNACLQDGAEIKPGDQIDAAFFRRTFTGIQEDPDVKSIFPTYNFFEIPQGETVDAPEQFPYYAPNSSFRENREMTGRTGRYTVVGFMETPIYEKESAAAYSALTYLDEKTLADAEQSNLSLLIDYKQAPWDLSRVLGEIVGSENVECNDIYLSLTAESSDGTMNRMVQLMTIFLVLLILFASIILIYNVFNLSYRERCKYLGMLSSVGATAKQKRSSVYYEAFYLLVFALPVGLLAGFAVIQGGMMLLRPFLMKLVTADGLHIKDVPVSLCISWQGVAAVVLLCIVTVLLSAFLPARKISKTGAVESIRGDEKLPKKSYSMSPLVHQKHGAEKMLAHHFMQRQPRKKRSISLAITIFLVILIVTAFGVDSIHVILDMKTGNRNMITLAMDENEGYLLCESGMGIESTGEEKKKAYQQFQAIRQELEKRSEVSDLKEWYQAVWVAGMGSDSGFYSREYMDAQMEVAKAYLGEQLSEKEINEQYFTDKIINSTCILVVDDRSLQEIAKRCGADYEMLQDPSRMGVVAVNDVAVSTDNMQYDTGKPKRSLYYDIRQISDLKQGETFSVNFYPVNSEEVQKQTFRVAGYADHRALQGYVSMNKDNTWLIMGKNTAEAFAANMGCDDMRDCFEEYLKIHFQEDSEELIAYLKSLEQDMGIFSFMDQDSLQIQDRIIDSVRKIVDIMLLCFVLLTSVICLMNLGNSIGGRMADRRKEFAILRSVGMTSGQIRSMLLRESGRILLSAGVAAVLISVLLISGMRYVLSALFGKLLLQIPYGLMGLAVLGTASAVILITLYSFGKERGQNILEEIRSETV